MIKYQFAYSSEKQVIDVLTLSKKARSQQEKYYCLGCEQELIAILGEKKVKHFRHKILTDIECSSETYLHKLAKIVFYETYNNCLDNHIPFKIQIHMNPICDFYEHDFLVSCSLKMQPMSFDLTKYFKKIYLELRTDSFCNLEESSEIKFLNFERNKKKKWCNGKCQKQIKPYAKSSIIYRIFVVFQSGKAAIVEDEYERVKNLIRSNNILYFKLLKMGNSKEYFVKEHFIKMIVDSYKQKINVKNCFLCRYHAPSNWEQTIFCKFLKKEGNSNMASNCQYFRPDSEVFSQYEHYRDRD